MIFDFIAYHKLQAQAANSVFNNLSKRYDCRWLMGPFNKERKGDVGILIDHMDYHDIKKSRFGYKYLFHLSHDIADVDIYKNENLHDFDVIFVPTIAHYNSCLQCGYEEKRVKLVGWPKYDNIERPIKSKEALISLNDEKQLTLLYAPTFASNYEWKKLFPFFSRIGCQVIVKNHIYVDNGQPLPLGQEEEYLKALTSIDEMEAKAIELGFLVIPRAENICNIFDRADILLSDSSSCLLEFLPFGVPIETGGGPIPGALGYRPEVSLLSEDVWLCPIEKIVSIDPKSFLNVIKAFSVQSENSIVRFQNGFSVGAEISHYITEYIYRYPPRYSSLLKTFISFLRRMNRKLGK